MSMDPSYGIVAPRFRLPDAAHVGNVSLQVSRLAASVAYYTGVVGLTELSRTGSMAVLGVPGASGGASLPLVRLIERTGARPIPRHGRLGLYHFAILLPDRRALGSFLVHLAETGVAAATADHAVSEAVYLWDPDGLGIEVYADRPREEWRRRGRELYMTTEPLDVRSLVEAAEGSVWSGQPPGTVIGHMHLHVGDLHRAEAVYHAALGFDKMVWSYPGALFVAAGGYHHHLGLNTWAAGAPPARDDDAKLLEWELVLPAAQDVEAAVASCRREALEAEVGGGRATILDPWGIAVALVTAT
jgi:catechol 2,3-dioxygenase